MDSKLGGNQNFIESKRKLLIPLYQREYKWTDDRISTLLNDIKIQDKFLGNIILDECEDCYEVVDGQQRLTTCILILAALFNKYVGKPLEQSAIMELLKPFGNFLLINDSIKDYLTVQNNVINLCIEETKDIYGQKDDFVRAFTNIQNFFNEFIDNNALFAFRQKFYSCKFLILINDEHDYNRSVEQLFLDINEKAQLLLVEDIFKGHCFEKYSPAYRLHLKELWVKIKTISVAFQKFGFEDTSQFIYLYLLENDKNDLPASLSESGKHYLNNKSMDEIDVLLQDMIKFGQSNLDFCSDLNRDDYRFIDLCLDGKPHANTSDHKILKQMCLSILGNTKTTYQKLPFLYYIYYVKCTDNGSNLLKYGDFRKIITNLYIYSILFSYGSNRKSKKSIDLSLRDSLRESTPENALEIVKTARILRKSKFENLKIKSTFSLDAMQFIYSIIDNYVATDEWIKMLYDHETNRITKEHLIIPDNKRATIKWKKEDSEIDIPILSSTVKQFKNRTIDYILINETLNGNIKSYDIVYKIKAIKDWYHVNSPLPKHISIFIEFIESMPGYQKLKGLKAQIPTHDELIHTYNEFIIQYFTIENELLEKIYNAFINSFKND